MAATDAAAAVAVHVSANPFHPAFLQSPGRSPIPWSRWIQMFEDWLLAIGFPDDVPDHPLPPGTAARKAALLRSSLEMKGSDCIHLLLLTLVNRMQTL